MISLAPLRSLMGRTGRPPTLALPLKGGGDARHQSFPSPLEGEGEGGGYSRGPGSGDVA